MGIAYGTDGLVFNASGSGSRGRGDGSDVEQVNTHVEAGNKVKLESGADTTVRGAVVAGKRVEVEVGGDLNIASLQDSSTYRSRQQAVGGSISAGAGKSGGSVNGSLSRVEGDFASVTEQSGIRAGDEGFRVDVTGNTDLKGAKIASTDKAAAEGRNSLSTATLTQSDIENRSRYKAEGISAGTGVDGAKGSLAGIGVGIGSAGGNERSATRSGISQADIKITDDAAQQARTGKSAEQTIASINTDVSSDRDSSAKLTKTWNAQALQADVQAQAQIMEMFGKNVAKEIGNYATRQVDELDAKIMQAKTDAEKTALLCNRGCSCGESWKER
ncbi:MAG TPA: hemagglutinin repeat-containing protein [Herbaspirillum sp.]|uniref:hemagglutinin repeat-containing protein n=1 Tax=Herbaspirillum sp. TaxID=1890675 RepID=UPI002D5A521F|nr:hemagglutinin repeat-containing protein [Herbaspirillum sp.]HZG21535.1 hemagglutinin repeat-containing protein [Herbaspirillum sp.]